MVVAVLLRLGTPLRLKKRRSFLHLFVADVIKSFDTVDRGILDEVLGSFGLPAWFSHVRFRFKLAAGVGQSWTRDCGIPQGAR